MISYIMTIYNRILYLLTTLINKALVINMRVNKPAAVNMTTNSTCFIIYFLSLLKFSKSKAFLHLSTALEKCMGRQDIKLDTFLTLALDEDKWSASCPGYFNPNERDTVHEITGD
jgi:hypothetical protein